MAIDWNNISEQLADDLEFDLGGDTKLTGAEFKKFLTDQKGEIESRNKAITDRDTQLAGLKKYQEDTTALFGEAARVARGELDPSLRPGGQQQQQRPTGMAQNLQPSDRFDEEYGNDPLFAPFAKRYGERMMKEVQENIVKPLIEQQIAPEFKRRDDTLSLVTRLLLDEKQRNDFREITEWPDGTTLDAVKKFGTERGYFVPGGQQFGVIDFHRVNQEMMNPIRQDRAIKEAEARGEENAALRLRQNAQIIQMPNRQGGGGAKGPSRRAVGSADAVIDQALGEAAQDRETMKMLGQLAGR